MKKYCFALDLFNDPLLIKEYEDYHQNIWPSIRESILKSGITNMEIYRVDDRLFMIMETSDEFDFEKKRKEDELNLEVLKWERLMWKFQKSLPNSKSDEKWRLMHQIFQL